MIDRFGLLPDAGQESVRGDRAEARATPLGIRKLELGPESGRVIFKDNPDIAPEAVIGLMQSEPASYRMDGPDTLRVRREMPEAADRLQAAGELLDRLGAAPSAH